MEESKEGIAIRFNDCINDQNLDGLSSLMTDDHMLAIETARERSQVEGRQACIDAWKDFFHSFPDYRNIFESVWLDGETVNIAGHSVCSEKSLAGLALWRVVVRGGRVAVWHVLDDTVEKRKMLRIPHANRHIDLAMEKH